MNIFRKISSMTLLVIQFSAIGSFAGDVCQDGIKEIETKIFLQLFNIDMKLYYLSQCDFAENTPQGINKKTLEAQKAELNQRLGSIEIWSASYRSFSDIKFLEDKIKRSDDLIRKLKDDLDCRNVGLASLIKEKIIKEEKRNRKLREKLEKLKN